MAAACKEEMISLLLKKHLILSKATEEISCSRDGKEGEKSLFVKGVGDVGEEVVSLNESYKRFKVCLIECQENLGLVMPLDLSAGALIVFITNA